jgi:D-arabinose 1-dehydrogenase-like Zn-dependent alcohol dehydrogenase
MRAAYITAHGPADAIRVGELPGPVVGPADVLVKVHVVVVDPVDTFVRSGRYATPVPFPFVIGRDLAGESSPRVPARSSLLQGTGSGATASGTTTGRDLPPNSPPFPRTGSTACPTA